MQSVVFITQVLLLISVISIVIVILLENRNPLKTLSWTLVLIFLPIVGIILYLFLGEDHRKKYKILRKRYKGLSKKYELSLDFEHAEDYPEDYQKLVTLLQQINEASVLTGNEIDFYATGRAKFDQLFLDIEQARHHIHLLYYKVTDDTIGYELSDLLIKKATEGVKVRLIYDDVGSIKTKKKYFTKLKKGGVEVVSYLEVRFPLIAQRVNYRNHRKLVVIDGKIGFIGGMNVGDCYIDGFSWGKWRDVQIRIEGNSVKGLQKVFFMDWYFSQQTIETSEQYFPPMRKYDKNPMQIVSSGPVDKYNSIERGMFQAINGAKKNICIQTPYFMPSENILSALQTASMSGVEVTMILPNRSDSFFVDRSTHSYVKNLVDYGIHVYLYLDGFLHTKCMVVDDFLTIIGSANMDMRSFDLSFETDAFIYNKDTAQKAKAIFYEDLEKSKEVIKQEWKKRPFIRRLLESIMRVFTPLM